MRMLSFILGLVIFMSSIIACMDETDANARENSMQYFKDYKTGMCFATTDNATHTLAAVPCTREVENLLVNKHSKVDSTTNCK